MGYIPMLQKRKFSFKRLSEGKTGLLLKESPITLPLVLNRTAYWIIKEIDGKNSLDDMAVKMSAEFQGLDVSKADKDIMNVIVFLWNINILDWNSENPFEGYYTMTAGAYKFCLLRDLKNMEIMKHRTYFSPYANVEFELNPKSIEMVAQYSQTLYFELKKDGKKLIETGIQFNTVDLSLEIMGLYLAEGFAGECREVLRDYFVWIYDWCIRQNKLVADKEKVVLQVCTVDEKLNNFLQILDFRQAGDLDAEVEAGIVRVYVSQISKSPD